ncbi:gibberellin 2-beta-dioxygenase 8-like [Macadamia integrifolia]|uniref:gibberellin 2-beta-dioxygenase 8-like n=1 Tax=Macadamia integrifolia TaxID=60698 RepID=UPI001C4FA346|nr:gibberellin 2-beta-dioxygenase 8-like [Macadamia integrifolia]
MSQTSQAKGRENMSGQDISSYPPHFVQTSDSEPVGRVSNSSSPIIDDWDPLPCIDFQQLDPEEIGKACRDWGMFRLVNHGIPVELYAELQEQAKKLLSLPFETKQAQLQSPMSYFWGTPALTPNGETLSQGVEIVYRMEGIFVLLNPLSQMSGEDPMLKSFRNLLEEYGKHMGRLARFLFEALGKNVGMDPESSQPYLSEATGLIRIYRYLQCPEVNKVEGLNAHTDSSVLSILNQDEVGGLQIFRDDKWIEIKPIANTLVVNVGDMLQAMSNDEYKSATHRVMNKQKERISVCYFVFPADEGVIQSTKYKPFTYKEFEGHVQQDLKTIGVKVGLQRFRL